MISTFQAEFGHQKFEMTKRYIKADKCLIRTCVFRYEGFQSERHWCYVTDTLEEDIRAALRMTMNKINKKASRKRPPFIKRVLLRSKLLRKNSNEFIRNEDFVNIKIEIDYHLLNTLIINITDAKQSTVINDWIQKSIRKFFQVQALREFDLL